ncbi:MAG: hypothetical protein J6Q61_09475 [Bacteroidales bacterium]|nr:hypothetical protein [Bacteroidales bacterium]
MKLKSLIAAYKALGEAKVTKLEASEVLKIVKARKAMRTHAEDYDAFLKDCQEKFKPSNFDEIQEKVQKWDSLTDEEKKEVNKALIEYNNAINSAILEEIEKDIEVNVEKLSEDSLTKMLQENGWELKKLDELEVML